MKFNQCASTIFLIVVIVHLSCAVHEFLDYLPYSPLINFVNHKTEFIQNATLQPTYTPCQATQDSLSGTCLTKKDCLYIGGASHFLDRQCGVIGTCCTQINRKTNSVSTLKVSYFVRINNNNNNNNAELLNIHKVKLMNKNICQLRLDFEIFNLQSPTNVELAGSTFYYTCQNEYFKVVTDRKKPLGVEFLCGNNTNQHMYVQLYPRNSKGRTFRHLDTVELQVKLASVSSTSDWRIKITQLECPELRTSRSLKFENNDPADNDYYEEYSSVQAQARGGFYTIDTYDKLLAPPNCLQYFQESAGTVSSFNFVGEFPTNNNYINGLNYAICFKKNNCNTMRLQFTPYPSVLDMDASANSDSSCNYITQNFLEIPGVVSENGVTKFCSQDFDVPPINNQFEVETPGPFYMIFNSLNRNIGDNLAGFRMTYTICQ